MLSLNKSNLVTYAFQVGNLTFPLLVFLYLSKFFPEQALEFEVLIAWVATLAIFADLGVQSVLSQQIRLILKEKQLLSIYLLRLFTSIVSALSLYYCLTLVEKIIISPIYVILFALFFLFDFSFIHLGLKALNRVLFINLIRWLIILTSILFGFHEPIILLKISMVASILMQVFFGLKFLTLFKIGHFRREFFFRNVSQLTFLNVTNLFNIGFTKLDVVIASKVMPQQYALLYIFCKKLIASIAAVALVRSKLLLVLHSQKEIKKEVKNIQYLILLSTAPLAILIVIYAHFIGFDLSYIQQLFIITATAVTLLLISLKSIVQNSKVHKLLQFHYDLRLSAFAFILCLPLLFAVNFGYLIYLVFLLRAAYEAFYLFGYRYVHFKK